MNRVTATSRYCLERSSLIPLDERGAAVAARGPRGPLSDEHVAALTTGSRERRVVCRYLEMVRSNGPVRTTEDEFVAIAASFGRRNGIAYATWLEFGIEASVLDRAAIHR